MTGENILEIRLPAMTATMEQATILEWFVAPGDHVSEGRPIADVATDKVDMELVSPYEGTVVELLVEPGTVVPLGATIATIASETGDLLAGLELTEREPSPPASAEASHGIVPAAPPARLLARRLGVDLAEVEPTGARGQVTSADVEAFVRRREARPGEHADRVPEQTPAPSQSSAMPVDTARKLSVRRATAEIMGRSAAIPQFTLYRTIVLDRAAAHKGGRSWTTELVRALAGALREHPEVNSRWDDRQREPVPFDTVRIGVAIDRPNVGLIVAAVSDPDLVDPDEADRIVRSTLERARIGSPSQEDMAQPSITLSNLGGLGVDVFAALVFPPQAAILSVGSIRMRPVATADGGVKAALTCEVGLTVDHRVADGADGARFLETFARHLEG
ncbi:MAG: 2-oxo acid dehydrogenase subunit E2 [Actinobacteria bacterium]|nr:2-oxo acid dehydrogenase subunit E2 [Actinomycetota bacterium]